MQRNHRERERARERERKRGGWGVGEDRERERERREGGHARGRAGGREGRDEASLRTDSTLEGPRSQPQSRDCECGCVCLSAAESNKPPHPFISPRLPIETGEGGAQGRRHGSTETKGAGCKWEWGGTWDSRRNNLRRNRPDGRCKGECAGLRG